MTDVPSSSLRLWAKAVDDILMTVFLIPAFGWAAFGLFNGEGLWISWPYLIYLFAVPVLYEGLSLWFFGTSFGKWLFFLRVVHAQDPQKPLNAGQTLTRALAGRLSLFFSYALHAVALFRYDRTHFADWMGQTRVVTSRPRPRQVVNHWIIGSVAIAFLGWTGLWMASLFVQGMDFQGAGIFFSELALK